MTLFDQKRLADALAEFEACYALHPVYSTLYNIGQVQAGLGRAAEAIRTLEKYLAEGGEAIPVAQRALVETEIAAQRARVGEIVFRLEPTAATLRVDGVPLPLTAGSAAYLVAAGSHRVEVELDGYRPIDTEIDVPAGGTLPLSYSLEMQPRNSAPTATPNVKPSITVPTPTSPLRTVSYFFGATGIAAAGSGLVIALAGQSKHRQALREEDSGRVSAAYELELESVNQKALGYALMAAGGAALGAGAVMFVIALPRSAPHVRESSSLRCSPWLGAQSGGAAVEGRF